MNGPYALDFGAVMQVAVARGSASALLSELLPDIEAIIIRLLRSPDDASDIGGEAEG